MVSIQTAAASILEHFLGSSKHSFISEKNELVEMRHNLYKPNVRTNEGKQLISFMATEVWKDLPTPLKKLIQSVSAFPKQIIRYLLSEQRMN